MFFLNLRKDLSIANNNRLINNLRIASFNDQLSLMTARNYVNSLLTVDKSIINTVSEKADVTYVNNTVSNVAINPSVISSTINSYVEQAINTINIEKENAIAQINIYSYQGATGNTYPSSYLISNTINTTMNSALLQINNKKQNALEEITNKKAVSLEEINYEKNMALFQINSLSQNVANQINGLNNSVKQELLKKIDYLFEMFYHSNSEIIMEIYPL
jgi:uncharacterized protein YdbL (DUF1318 family)